jgi:serine/threonine-protein kinase
MCAQSAVVRGSRGSYRLLTPLGRGGMSQVWLAEPLTSRYGAPQTRVVVKVANNSPIAVEKLRFESEVLRMLNHPHLVSYVDSGVAGNLPFLVMEYIPGRDLESAYSAMPLDERDAKKLTIELLLALDYLHGLNIVHRDVKPKNLLQQQTFPDVKLIDLGTSAFFNRVGLREAVISPGGYTAPEQYRSTSSPQADIWSAGATLFFLLTGQHPIVDMPGYPNVQTRPPDPSKFKRDVSEETRKIIHKAMNWDPLQRYLSAREMISDLDRGVVSEESLEVPVLEVMGVKIRLEAERLVFGRLVPSQGTGTSITSSAVSEYSLADRVNVVRHGDYMEVFVKDPFNWISRRHFEIYRMGGKWYIRDLGSLNRTAVLSGGQLREIWRGYKEPGPPFELGERALIYVAYGSSLSSQPYIVVSFRAK